MISNSVASSLRCGGSLVCPRHDGHARGRLSLRSAVLAYERNEKPGEFIHTEWLG